MSVTDYVNSNSNISLCGTAYLSSYSGGNYETCRKTNWIDIDIAQNTSNPKTITPYSGELYSVWDINTYNGYLGRSQADQSNSIVPVFYLNLNITLTGSGTEEDPYIPTLK